MLFLCNCQRQIRLSGRVENFYQKKGKTYPAIPSTGRSFHVMASIVLLTAGCTLEQYSTTVPLYPRFLTLSIDKWLEIGKKIPLQMG
jgi:hypothetical protein